MGMQRPRLERRWSDARHDSQWKPLMLTIHRSAWDLARHFLPFLRWLPTYNIRANLAGDLTAALTVTAVAAPEAVSYAGIAGLPASQGLYTGLLAPLAYAVAGASPQLITGPTAIMCILTGNAIPSTWGGEEVGSGTGLTPTGQPTELRVRLAALLSLYVAMLQAIIALFRLGSLMTLIPTPVVAGFTTGSALLTASSQFATLVGLQKCKGSSGGSCTFAEAIAEIIEQWGQIKWPVAAMSAVCMAILIVVKYGPELLWKAQTGACLSGGTKDSSSNNTGSSKYEVLLDDSTAQAPRTSGSAPKPAKLPLLYKLISTLAPLVLVAVTVPLVASGSDLIELEKWGLNPPKVIPAGVPPPLLPFGDGSGLEKGSQSDHAGLIRNAFPLAIIGYMGASSIVRTVARQAGGYPTDGQQELWAQVACNTACGVGQGLPITGSFSRTAVNAAAGAKTALASALTGAMMALALSTITGTLSQIPDVARSAIVIVAIAKMVELSLLVKLWRKDLRDWLAFTITVLVVLLLDAATGLLVGTVFAWVATLTRSWAHQSQVRLLGVSGSSVAGRAATGASAGYGAGAGKVGLAGAKAKEEGFTELTTTIAELKGWIPPSPVRALPLSAADLPSSLAAEVTLGTDALLFPHADTVAQHITEAATLFTGGEEGQDSGKSGIAVLLLDLSSCYAADSTGCAALLSAISDVVKAASGAGGLVVVAHSLSTAYPAVQAVLQATAADGGSCVQVGGEDAGSYIPGARGVALGPGAVLLSCNPASGATAKAPGALLLVQSQQEAYTLAARACAAAVPGQEEDVEGGSGSTSASASASASGSAPTRAQAQDAGVQGVPLSPLLLAQQQARRRQPVSLLSSPEAAASGQAGPAGGASGGCVSALATALRMHTAGAAELQALVTAERPLLCLTV